MNGTQSIRTIIGKELRTYFLSPVALLFLGVFSTVNLFLFFTYSKFFARNLADVTPLFQWLPVLLIFLVSSLTMRQWSEEQKMGTLEVLLTLPVSSVQLVLGKFLAGMVLLTVALALTLPLPLTAWWLGPLDWGPVIGGYVAALLLGSTYMAIGLCVSARTDNQIVALMVSCLLGGALYAIGSEAVVGLFGTSGAEMLRALGSGSRFASIERGVLDLRDLAYYFSLTFFFLALNVSYLEATRMEAVGGDDSGVQRFATRAAFALGMGLVSFAVYSHQDMTAGALAGYLVAAFLLAGPATASFLGQQVAASTAPQKRRKALSLAIVLVGLNALALNFWLAPVGWVRADLTANGEYSVGETTARVLADLDEPLEITGYFSAKTHPLLAPLVPRIQNLLAEYQVVGGRKLKVSFVDPNTDEEIENEINETYGIKPVPFRVSSRHEKSVVNSYFHLLVRYGDEHQVLGFDKLIEVYADTADVQVELRNLEYDLTRAIKKVTQGFQSIESMLARHDKGAKLTAYITPDLLPEEFKDVPERLKKVADELAEKSGGRFRMETVDPGSDPALQQELYEKYRFKPMAADLFGTQRFYMHLLFEAGDHAEQIFPQGGLTEADLRTGIEAAIKRSTPGFLKTVGLLTEDAAPPPNPYGMPPQGPTKDFQRLEQVFSEEYEFKRLDLSDGVVPGDVDVLIVAKAGALDEKEQFALDQYLMRGGAMIVLSGAYDVSQDMKAKAVDPSLLELLKSWGVEVETGLVMDPQNARFPVPVEERRGPLVFQRIVMMDYPFFPDVRRDGHKEGHVALQGVPSVAVTWASPVKVKEGLEDLTHEVLLRSGPGSTLSESTNLQPDMDAYPATGFAPGKDPGRKQLAVSLSGTFQSHFADKPSPLFTDEEEDEEEPEAPAGMPPGMPNFNLGSTTGEDGEMPLEPPAPVAVAEAPASDGVSAAAPAAEAPSGGAADAAADASVAAPAAEAAEAGAAAAAPASDGVAASAPAEDAEASGEGGDAPAADGAEGEKEMDRTGRTLKASTPDARLVVVGSSSFASDMIASLDFRSGTDSFAGNLVLARNLVDWSLEDTELLQIRSVGRFARTLRPMKPAERTTFEVLNYVVVLVALFGVGVVAATRRRMARPIPLV